MSFVEPTGNSHNQICSYCGEVTTFEELESWNRDGHTFVWRPVHHRAPCGAHCAAGSYEQGETDVHIPFRGSCPRCGATQKDEDRA